MSRGAKAFEGVAVIVSEAEEFCCPECGGSQFGTSGETGHCHGSEGEGSCGFEWPREDDWKVFVLVTRARFESKEEFEEA